MDGLTLTGGRRANKTISERVTDASQHIKEGKDSILIFCMISFMISFTLL